MEKNRLNHIKLFEEQNTSDGKISVDKDVLEHLLFFYGDQSGNISIGLDFIKEAVAFMQKWNITLEDYYNFYSSEYHYMQLDTCESDVDQLIFGDYWETVVIKAALENLISTMGLNIDFGDVTGYLDFDGGSSIDVDHTEIHDMVVNNVTTDRSGNYTYASNLDEAKYLLISFAIVSENYTVLDLCNLFIKKGDSDSLEKMVQMGVISEDDFDRIKKGGKHKDIIDL